MSLRVRQLPRGGKIMRKWTAVLWTILTLWVISSASARAQEVHARIRGTVTDASGGGVPGAEVKATNAQTGVATMVTTEADGTFQFLQLPVGQYDVSISKPGFRTFRASNILLVLNQVYDLNAALQVGQ